MANGPARRGHQANLGFIAHVELLSIAARGSREDVVVDVMGSHPWIIIGDIAREPLLRSANLARGEEWYLKSGKFKSGVELVHCLLHHRLLSGHGLFSHLGLDAHFAAREQDGDLPKPGMEEEGPVNTLRQNARKGPEGRPSAVSAASFFLFVFVVFVSQFECFWPVREAS